MEKKKLTCTFFLGGKPIEKLTSQQTGSIAARLGEVMSRYYTAHLDEFKKLKRGS
jgi:hypothetical protein